MKKRTSNICAVATLSACVLTLPALAQSTATGNGTTTSEGTSAGGTGQASTALQAKLSENFDRLFLLKAVQGNMAEVMTGQLALQRSSNAQVRRLAQMLIQHHGQANRELTPILTAKGLPLPRTVGAMHAATYDTLSRLRGARFDQSFMAAQTEAHENTITLYQQELALGKEDDARTYTTKYLPIILDHTTIIYAVAGAVQAPGSAERMTALRTTQTELNTLMNASMAGMSGAMNNGAMNNASR